MIWVDEWPPSKVASHIAGLPEDSAYFRAEAGGHSTMLEVLAQIRDAVNITAHGWRLEGKPQPYARPKFAEDTQTASADLSSEEGRSAVARFFGK